MWIMLLLYADDSARQSVHGKTTYYFAACASERVFCRRTTLSFRQRPTHGREQLRAARQILAVARVLMALSLVCSGSVYDPVWIVRSRLVCFHDSVGW